MQSNLKVRAEDCKSSILSSILSRASIPLNKENGGIISSVGVNQQVFNADIKEQKSNNIDNCIDPRKKYFYQIGFVNIPVDIRIGNHGKVTLRFEYKHTLYKIPLNCGFDELSYDEIRDFVDAKIRKVDGIITIRTLLDEIEQCDECGGQRSTRKKCISHFIDLYVKRDKRSLNDPITALLDVDATGRTLPEQWAKKYGLPHKLRQIKSLFSKKNLVLFKRWGWDTKNFGNFISFVPQSSVSLPFSTDDNEVERIINFFDARKESDPVFYSIYLLAFGCGLRASEIYQVKGRDFTTFNGQHYLLLPFATKRTKLKQLNGAVEKVGISKQVYEHFFQCLPDEDVIKGGLRLHKRFVRFLKEELGIQDNKACHRLRKILGARLATTAGIYHASKTLRNSVAVCERYYSDLTAHANELRV